MNRILLATLSFIVLYSGQASSVLAAEVCPAINCDCDSLAKEQWVSVCRKHESRIKKECVNNSNTPKDYCLVHGIDAMPLPLALNVSHFDESYLAPAEPEVNKNLKALLWSISADIEQAKLSKENNDYARLFQVLKLIDSNIDSAFEQQQILAQSKAQLKLFGNVKSSWKNYSKETFDAAEKLEGFGDELTALLESAKTKKETKIYSVLAQTVYRMSGKSYEHSGYGYGKAGLDSEAADAWQDASSQSLNLANINKKVGGKLSGRKFSEFQTAARLHRASYHWLLSEDVIDSERVLLESRQYLGREDQKVLGSLLERLEGESAQDGELTER